MKKYVLTIIVLCSIMALAVPGWAVTIGSGMGIIDVVGLHDTSIAGELSGSGGLESIVNWIKDQLGTSFTAAGYSKYDSMPSYEIKKPPRGGGSGNRGGKGGNGDDDNSGGDDDHVTAVPEADTFLLLGSGLLSLFFLRKKFKK